MNGEENKTKSTLINIAYQTQAKFHDHLLEQYKLYVQAACDISRLRYSSNNIFLTIHSLITTGIFLTLKNDYTTVPNVWRYPILAGGIMLCFIWIKMIRHYSLLNGAKFKVIHEMEKELPASCYDDEWEKLGRGKDKSKYEPLTRIEKSIPAIFGIIYFSMLILNIFAPPN